MSVAFEKFKKQWPNYEGEYQLGHENWYSQMLEAVEPKEYRLSIVPEQKIQEFYDIAATRFYLYGDFPNYIREKIIKLIDFLVSEGIETITLTGSYLNGQYIDEYTDQYFIDLKAEVAAKSKVSDFDLIVEPYLSLSGELDGIKYETIPKEYSLHSDQYERLIYKDGKILI